MASADSPIDKLDRQIIRILQKDGRTTNTEIARQLRVTETTIRNRLNRLVSEDLLHIVAVPTPKAVGASLSAIIGISVQLGKIREVAEQLVQYQETRYVGISTGRYDIIAECFFANQAALLSFTTEKLGSLAYVLDMETSLILQVSKFAYEWELPATDE